MIDLFLDKVMRVIVFLSISDPKTTIDLLPPLKKVAFLASVHVEPNLSPVYRAFLSSISSVKISASALPFPIRYGRRNGSSDQEWDLGTCVFSRKKETGWM